MAQFAGGVPAMCDGVTQASRAWVSLFSRDVIAMSTAVALTHDLYDGAMLLGVCDKIVPGLLLARSFGHLPAIFVPAGPMPSGLSNKEKANVRKLHAQAKVAPTALLEAEMAAYHGSEGTCTFYGTANSNQLLLEAMGLMLPGRAFVQPNDRRPLLTRAAAARMAALANGRKRPRQSWAPGQWIDERCWSTPSSRCWRRADRPITRCTGSPSRVRPEFELTLAGH